MRWVRNQRGNTMAYVLLCLTIFLLFVPATLESLQYGMMSQQQTSSQIKATQYAMSSFEAVSTYVHENRNELECNAPTLQAKMDYLMRKNLYSTSPAATDDVNYVDTEGESVRLQMSNTLNGARDGILITSQANVGKALQKYEYEYKRQPLNNSSGLTQITTNVRERQAVCERNRLYLSEDVNTTPSNKLQISSRLTPQNHTNFTYPLGKNMSALITDAINAYEKKMIAVPSKPSVTIQCENGICNNLEELNQKIKMDRSKVIVAQISNELFQNSFNLIKNYGKKLILIVPGQVNLDGKTGELQATLYVDGLRLNQSKLRVKGSLYVTQNINLSSGATLSALENIIANSLILDGASTLTHTNIVQLRNLQGIDGDSRIFCNELFVTDRTQYPIDMRVTAKRLFFIGDSVYTSGDLTHITTETLVIKNTLDVIYGEDETYPTIGSIISRDVITRDFSFITISGDFMVANNVSMSNTCEGEIQGYFVVGGKMNVVPTSSEISRKWYIPIGGMGNTQLLINGGTPQWGLSPKA